MGVDMELNGVANISMIIQMAKSLEKIDSDTAKDINEQLLLLERYMLAYADHKRSIKSGSYGALIVEVDEPNWHDIRENPQDYPTNHERYVAIEKNGENNA